MPPPPPPPPPPPGAFPLLGRGKKMTKRVIGRKEKQGGRRV